jgi:hypothetical protein
MSGTSRLQPWKILLEGGSEDTAEAAAVSTSDVSEREQTWIEAIESDNGIASANSTGLQASVKTDIAVTS